MVTITLPHGYSSRASSGDKLACSKRLSALHLVSKKISTDSAFARKNALSVHLHCEIWPENFESLYTDPDYEDLRPKVTKLTFSGYACHNMHRHTFEKLVWNGIGFAFPNVKEVHLEWMLTRFKYERGSKKRRYSKEWKELWQPGAMKAFHECEMVRDFSDKPLDRLKLWYLDEVLNENGRHCKIILTVTMQWLDTYCNPVFHQVSLDCTLCAVTC